MYMYVQYIYSEWNFKQIPQLRGNSIRDGSNSSFRQKVRTEDLNGERLCVIVLIWESVI